MAVLIHDTFTGSAGSLVGHVSESGHSWGSSALNPVGASGPVYVDMIGDGRIAPTWDVGPFFATTIAVALSTGADNREFEVTLDTSGWVAPWVFQFGFGPYSSGNYPLGVAINADSDTGFMIGAVADGEETNSYPVGALSAGPHVVKLRIEEGVAELFLDDVSLGTWTPTGSWGSTCDEVAMLLVSSYSTLGMVSEVKFSDLAVAPPPPAPAPPPPPAGTVFLEDQFSGAAGALTGHESDSGDSWEVMTISESLASDWGLDDRSAGLSMVSGGVVGTADVFEGQGGMAASTAAVTGNRVTFEIEVDFDHLAYTAVWLEPDIEDATAAGAYMVVVDGYIELWANETEGFTFSDFDHSGVRKVAGSIANGVLALYLDGAAVATGEYTSADLAGRICLSVFGPVQEPQLPAVLSLRVSNLALEPFWSQFAGCVEE